MNQNDKSVIITHEFFPFRGGVATYCLELAAAGAHARAVEVWAAGCDPGRGTFAYIVQWLGVGTRLHPLDLFRFARRLRSKENELREANVILASVGAMMAWMLAGRPKAKRLTLVFHGSEILKFARWPWRKMSRQLVLAADRVACVSKAMERLLLESHLGCQRREIVLAPGAPGREIRQRAETIQPTVRMDREVRILCLARIHPRKGQMATALAIGGLPKAIRDRVVLWLAGTGDPGYLKTVQSALRAQEVRWEEFGEVSDEKAAELYAECDFYIMSSMSQKGSVEGLGITYLEAALFGKASVAFDSGGVREAVIDGVTGLLAPEGDFHALGEKIEMLIRDMEGCRRMGEAAKAHVASHFNWATTAERLLG